MLVKLLARFLARPKVADWIIRRAMKTPYRHIIGPDGSLYMERYWLFNAYGDHAEDNAAPFPWLPSIRVHRIMRPDSDRALHDHPWNARTFILKGFYREKRRIENGTDHFGQYEIHAFYNRLPGDTAALKFGEFHAITDVSDGGVWTLFCTGKYRGTWGFDVKGTKVPWREYLARNEDQNQTP